MKKDFETIDSQGRKVSIQYAIRQGKIKIFTIRCDERSVLWQYPEGELKVFANQIRLSNK